MLKQYFGGADEYDYSGKKIKFIDDYEKEKERKKKIIHPKDIFTSMPKGFKNDSSKYRRAITK